MRNALEVMRGNVLANTCYDAFKSPGYSVLHAGLRCSSEDLERVDPAVFAFLRGIETNSAVFLLCTTGRMTAAGGRNSPSSEGGTKVSVQLYSKSEATRGRFLQAV